jgi:hypothetical protein
MTDRIAEAFAQAFAPPRSDKDWAVTIARQVLREGRRLDVAEEHILAQQLLRALALPESG